MLGDRLDRRKLMMTVQALGAALALGFAFLVDSEFIRSWHAYAYVLVSGAFLAIAQPLQQVLVSNVVPREAVSNAYAVNVLTVTGTRIFGPFVGGLLIFWLGYFWNFALEATLYFAVVLFLLSMRLRYTASLPDRGTQRFTPLADFRDGVLHLWRQQREILHMMVLSVIPNTILHPVWFLLPLFTVQVLHADVDMGGYLLAVTGIGGFMSTLVIASFGLPSRRGYLLLITAAFSSCCTMAFAFSSWLPAAFVFLALMSLFQSHYRTTQGTVVLTIVPDQFRTRTFQCAGIRAGIPDRRQRTGGNAGRRDLGVNGHPDPGSVGTGADGNVRCGVAQSSRSGLSLDEAVSLAGVVRSFSRCGPQAGQPVEAHIEWAGQLGWQQILTLIAQIPGAARVLQRRVVWQDGCSDDGGRFG